MREFRLRTDLQRTVLDGFALPLGISPLPGQMKPPQQGYTVAYVSGEDWRISNEQTWEVLKKFPALKQDVDLGKSNKGISIVVL